MITIVVKRGKQSNLKMVTLLVMAFLSDICDYFNRVALQIVAGDISLLLYM
jgi:hypothetical protein